MKAQRLVKGDNGWRQPLPRTVVCGNDLARSREAAKKRYGDGESNRIPVAFPPTSHDGARLSRTAAIIPESGTVSRSDHQRRIVSLRQAATNLAIASWSVPNESGPPRFEDRSHDNGGLRSEKALSLSKNEHHEIRASNPISTNLTRSNISQSGVRRRTPRRCRAIVDPNCVRKPNHESNVLGAQAIRSGRRKQTAPFRFVVPPLGGPVLTTLNRALTYPCPSVSSVVNPLTIVPSHVRTRDLILSPTP